MLLSDYKRDQRWLGMKVQTCNALQHKVYI